MEENLPQVQENHAQNGPPYTVMDAAVGPVVIPQLIK